MRSEPQAADLCLLIIPCALKTLEFCADHSIVAGMLTILSAIVSLVLCLPKTSSGVTGGPACVNGRRDGLFGSHRLRVYALERVRNAGRGTVRRMAWANIRSPDARRSDPSALRGGSFLQVRSLPSAA